MSKVFLVDDDVSVTRALQRGLALSGFDVEVYRSPMEFLKRTHTDEPACAVLDLRMPELSGLDVQRMLQSDSTLPIIFLTAFGSVATSVQAMKQGAFEFLLKPVDLAVLIDTVERALVVSTAGLQARAHDKVRKARLSRLTARERQVGDCIANGLLNKEIAAQLGISEKTIKIHRARVMHKLQIRSVAELVRLLDGTEPPTL